MIDAERVDFVAVPVRDLARNPNSDDRWVEYETGNVTLALVQPNGTLLRHRHGPCPDGREP